MNILVVGAGGFLGSALLIGLIVVDGVWLG